MYGYWTPKQRTEYPELVELARMLDELEPLNRVRVLAMLDLIRQQAVGMKASA
jgi:hypothetical protein